MRRLSILAVLVVALVALVAVARDAHVGAQDGTPVAGLAGHPLVGSWDAVTDTTNPNGSRSLFIVAADGTYVELDADGATAIGTWQATGPSTAVLTALSHQTDPKGTFVGTLTIRAAITVGADGTSFTATYTLEWTTPDGKRSGQAGPGSAAGTKIAVEAPGTPAMTIPQLFQSLQGAATPQATPAA
jgi:hypothetical protein